MLKKMLFFSFAATLFITQPALADRAAERGAIGGAVGGALLGQAIGRNTEGTLIGAAIGGVLGYAVGNEMDREDARLTRAWSPPPRVVNRYAERECREMEVVARVDGRPELVYGTVCNEDGEWVLQGDRRVARQMVIIDRRPYYPPPVVHYHYKTKGRWPEARQRQAFQRRHGRDRYGARIIIR